MSNRIARIGEGNVCTTIIVAAELRFGAGKRGSSKLTRQVESVLDALQVLPFDAPADEMYAELRARLEKSGQIIGGNDLLIAAQTMASGYTLVTGNEREFAQVSALGALLPVVRGAKVAELACENWLQHE